VDLSSAGRRGRSWRPPGTLAARDLCDGKSAGDQEFFGEVLADLIEQAAEGYALVGESAARCPVGPRPGGSAAWASS
jgi:hypothetical protein